MGPKAWCGADGCHPLPGWNALLGLVVVPTSPQALAGEKQEGKGQNKHGGGWMATSAKLHCLDSQLPEE